MDKNKKLMYFGGIAIVLIFFFIIAGRGEASSVEDAYVQLEDVLIPVTSITSNESSTLKASVYESNYSVVETAKLIIESSSPESNSILTDDEIITLYYDKEIVVIYKGEESKTYVQISSREYVHRSGYYSVYRPYKSYIFRRAMLDYEERYYDSDSTKYGNKGYVSSKSNSEINVIKTGDNSSKVTTNSSWNVLKGSSVRAGSNSSRNSIGGGTSHGK